MKVWRWVVLIGLAASVTSMGSVFVPDWAGDADATSAYYSFPTAANPLIPDAETNLFGAVQSQLVLGGPNGIGWGDPNDPFALTRLDDTGTWSIDSDGYMSFIVPVADGSLSPYTLELVIDVIAYQGITQLPAIEVAGSVIDFGVDQYIEEVDPLFPAASWQHQVWTGTVSIASSSGVSLNINGTAGGSVIDRVSIYTQAIPEPAAISFILLTAGLTLVIKRRFS